MGPFPVPRKETERLDHCLDSRWAYLPCPSLTKEFTKKLGSLPSFILTLGWSNIRVLHHTTIFQPVPVPCSVGHPRTGFSTDLKNSYTKWSLCYPREHPPFYQTQLFQQWQSDMTGLTGPRGKEKRHLNGWPNTLEELPEGEQEGTQYVSGQSNVFVFHRNYY